ncbi:Photosystem II reaction center Psb28 protein [Heracleum sosnowskyi]|uniref:Photosystem II reaction center Psb28 protein n=1 Tax=Heracleum sosnowskyi TaxID=360622 RepID=A0AAD8GRC9_9APIA|nr:Photosystem II reaction center Psb28 protein [Heracleum sosnowskyi]
MSSTGVRGTVGYVPPEYGITSGAIHSVHSSFSVLHLSCSQYAPQRKKCQMSRLSILMVKASIQFIQGTDEQTVPDVRLRKSRDGTNGMAIFRFDEPSVFDSSGNTFLSTLSFLFL